MLLSDPLRKTQFMEPLLSAHFLTSGKGGGLRENGGSIAPKVGVLQLAAVTAAHHDSARWLENIVKALAECDSRASFVDDTFFEDKYAEQRPSACKLGSRPPLIVSLSNRVAARSMKLTIPFLEDPNHFGDAFASPLW